MNLDQQVAIPVHVNALSFRERRLKPGAARLARIIGAKIKARYTIQLKLTRHKGEEMKSRCPGGAFPIRCRESRPVMITNETSAVIPPGPLFDPCYRVSSTSDNLRSPSRPIIGFA